MLLRINNSLRKTVRFNFLYFHSPAPSLVHFPRRSCPFEIEEKLDERERQKRNKSTTDLTFESCTRYKISTNSFLNTSPPPPPLFSGLIAMRERQTVLTLFNPKSIAAGNDLIVKMRRNIYIYKYNQAPASPQINRKFSNTGTVYEWGFLLRMSDLIRFSKWITLNINKLECK